MRVGVDIDGVLYDFVDSLKAYLVTIGYSAQLCTPATSWEFYEDWGLTIGEFIEAANRGVDVGIVFGFGSPFTGSREALMRLREAGHTVHLVTDRFFGAPGRAAELTHTWLAKHGLGYDSITFSADKTIVDVDVAVDDKLANYDALDRTGCVAWLYDRPWNQDADTRRHRVASLGEFADKVLAYGSLFETQAAVA